MHFIQGLASWAPLLVLLAAVAPAPAVALDVTPDTLLEQANRQRNARELPWDPTTGRLGNLRHVNIVAPDCTVRVIPGAENRVYAGRGSVRVADSPRVPDRQPGAGPVARNLTITATSAGTDSAIPRIGDANGPVCFTLQVATAHEFIVGGDRLAVLFDRVELPVLTLYLNPSYGLKVWFRDVRVGSLGVDSNAFAAAGGTGEVEWLSLRSSQGSTALLFHETSARHVGVMTTTVDPRFSIRIGPETEASYYQPARAVGDMIRHYPIWIEGPVAALKIPVGRVNAMPITEAIRDEARKLREEVLGRVGSMPPLPAGRSTPPPAGRAMAESVSTRQRVADALQPFLPAGVRLGKVDLWKNGGALEGVAPDDAAVHRFVKELERSGEVRGAQVAVIRREADRVSYRILVSFMCESPGERGACLPGTGAYTSRQVEDALKPVLGADIVLTMLELEESGSIVHLEGRAREADAMAALDRIKAQAPWLQLSSSRVGNGGFKAWLRMVCTVPPRTEGTGICAADGRR